MLTQILQNMIPGVRSIRPSLIAGLLWTLVLWLLLSDSVPSPEETSGFAEQVYALASAAGPITTVAVVSILIFVIGALTTGLMDALGRVVGNSIRYIQWQLNARSALKRLPTRIAQLRSEAQAVTVDSKKRTLEGQVAKLNEDCQKLTEAQTYFRVKRTDETRSIVLRSRGGPNYETELSVIQKCYRQGLRDELNASNAWIEVIRPDLESGPPGEHRLARELSKELGTDPLDLLRVLDPRLFLDLDRERAEREVRLALSTPLIALGLVLANQLHNSLWILLSAAALTEFVRSSISRSGERERVLNLMANGRLETDAMKDALSAGHNAIRDILAKRAAEETTKHESAQDKIGSRTPQPNGGGLTSTTQ